jgi:hypothetical protein
MSGGLAKRLVDFVNAFMEPMPARQAAGRPERGFERYQLARQLLGTLSPDVLVETGHIKHRDIRGTSPARRRRGPDVRTRPQPSPVGDLARPRPEIAPGPVAR